MATPPRIDWSHDGGALLAFVDGTLRRHALDGASSILDGPDLLDAVWQVDGSIVAIDVRNRARRYRDGARAELPTRFETQLTYVRLARGGDCYLARGGTNFVATLEGRELWKSIGHGHGITGYTSAEISSDGKRLAFATETIGEAHFNWQREAGRGWVVLDASRDRVLDRSWTARPPRAPGEMPGTARLAFDAGARRLAIAIPEPGPCVGAIRIGKDERYPRAHLGGARAVALDDKGILAAYAYPRGIEDAPRRLRVDYLEPGVKGGSSIAVLDTLWIDPDLDDIVALAFDRTSRRIACLDARGRIDVVPVP